MNKKGWVMLWIALFGFIIAIFVFYGAVGTHTPGGEVLYLGQNEIELFQTYEDAEKQSYYIELSAKLSASAASQDDVTKFQQDFESLFAKYLEHSSLSIENYSLSYEPGSGQMKVVGTTNAPITLSRRNHNYSIKPSFKTSVPFEGAGEVVFV